MIDTHTHVYSEDFKTDIGEIMDRASAEGVKKFYLPGIDSRTHDAMLSLEAQYPGKCMSMMGLHPCSVAENYEDELRIVESWLARRAFAAVGEIGLDFYWSRSFETQQYNAFHRQVELALHYKVPVVIHSRDSLQESIGLIGEHQQGDLTGIFHCFSGDVIAGLKIIDAGFYLGVGGVITFKNAGMAEVFAQLPLDRLVLETDAPYLTPAPFRGKRNEPAYLKYVVDKLALVKGVSHEEVVRITTENAEKIFGS